MRVGGGILVCFLSTNLLYLPVYSQTATMTSSGAWNVATNWSGSNIGDLVTETVTINNNINPTVPSGYTATVGNTTLSNNNTLQVTGTLNIGDASNAFNLTTNNNANISVSGTLIIWGNLVVNNNINWTISGTVIIKGNVILSNNANVTVSGNLSVNGNFTGGNNTNVTVSGSIDVDGNVNVGNGSNLNGCAGCFHLDGTCTGPASFCGSTALPVTLLFLKAKVYIEYIDLMWATASEINSDHFAIQRSVDGSIFTAIGNIPASGNTHERKDYTFRDTAPVPGKLYYRLEIVDIDGAIAHSNVIQVLYELKNKQLLVSPNPASASAVTVTLSFMPDDDTYMDITDLFGRPLLRKRLQSFTETFDFHQQLHAGSYFVRVATHPAQLVARLVIRD
ncbi:MAG TPA: hypothetical protein VIN08_08130 [Ohtaekwangia sp.]|uniref:hypothetical protein n=1 Tax=Ohtaekwangia sp. TaxID=2066019 RepID=UPI002F91F518